MTSNEFIDICKQYGMKIHSEVSSIGAWKNDIIIACYYPNDNLVFYTNKIYLDKANRICSNFGNGNELSNIDKYDKKEFEKMISHIMKKYKNVIMKMKLDKMRKDFQYEM